MMAAKKKPNVRELAESLSSAELLTLLRVAVGKLERPRRASKIVGDWSKEIRTCPKCEHQGPVDPDFGTKLVRGIVRAQSWCKSCRASTSYYNKPRVRKTAATKS